MQKKLNIVLSFLDLKFLYIKFYFFYFSNCKFFQIFKIFICTELCTRFVRSWYLFCVRNLYYVKNLITIQIQTESSLNIVSKFATTVQGSTSAVAGRIRLYSRKHFFHIYNDTIFEKEKEDLFSWTYSFCIW